MALFGIFVDNFFPHILNVHELSPWIVFKTSPKISSEGKATSMI